MSDEWPVFGQNRARTGYSPSLTRPQWPVDEQWRHGFAGKAAWNAPVVDAGGDVFVHIKMTQVDVPNFRSIGSDGTLNWALKTSWGMGPHAPPPTIADDRVVLPDSPDSWVVEADTGGMLYRTQLHPSGVTHPFPAVADGRIHVGFQAFSLETGEQLWHCEPDGPERVLVRPDGEAVAYPDGPTGVAPSVRDETVYVAGTLYDGEIRFRHKQEERNAEERSSLIHSGEAHGQYYDEYDEWGHVHALDASTGSLEWKSELDTPIRDMTSPVATERAIYVVDGEPRLHALDSTTGRHLWTVSFDAETVSGWRPAVANGRVFIGAGNKLHAFDAQDGTTKWQMSFSTGLAGPPAIAEGVVHVSTSNGTIAAITIDGEKQWELNLSESLRTGPVITNGRVYVAGQELVCLGGQTV